MFVIMLNNPCMSRSLCYFDIWMNNSGKKGPKMHSVEFTKSLKSKFTFRKILEKKQKKTIQLCIL